MLNIQKPKKKLIVSYKNLSDELRILFRETYPEGDEYKEHIQKGYSAKGEPLFLVPLETDDTSYLVKFDMKVDTAEALEKEMFSSEDKSTDDDYNPMSETLDKDDDIPADHTEHVLNHGSYEEMMAEMTNDGKKKKGGSEFDDIRKELDEEFGDDDDEEEYKDDYADEGDDEDDEFEPTAEDLADIDSEFLADLANPASSKGSKTTKKTAVKKAATKTTKTTKTATKNTTKAAPKTTAKSTVKTSVKPTTKTATKKSK